MGEAGFGLMKGVLSTLPGFIGGHEVVEVKFDPLVLPFEKLVKKAEACNCAAKVFTRNEKQQKTAARIVGDRAVPSREKVRPDNDLKYYLSRKKLKAVPMTPMQAMRINAMVNEADHETLLSPSQKALLAVIEAHPNAAWKNVIGREMITAWREVERFRAEKIGR